MFVELNIQSRNSNNFNKLIKIWSENLHLFPDKWKPPLIIEKTFDESYITPEALEKIQKGELVIQKISDTLYTLEVSEKTGEFPKEAKNILRILIYKNY